MEKTTPIEKQPIQFRHPQIVDNGRISTLIAGASGGDDEGDDQRCIESPVRLVPRD